MQLNSRQERIYTLANLLGTGKPVSAEKIIGTLGCSEPTLSRALKELRESYAADIKYSKAGHSYQLVSFGQLDKKTLRRMNEALSQHAELRSQGISTKVLLDKDLKTTVSLSIRRRILRKIDRLAKLTGTSRSEAVETLAEMKIEDFIKVHQFKNRPE
ncbi:tellurium resistance protein TerW [Klebsiella oxytoca]|uniref:Tellurium resistance protein TerW n=12 Tax=Enterobacteriaceae TaxID=543 RepID=A0A7H0EVD9_KLEVA|nr:MULTISPECIES: tellurium resistance protein TerW [Enterobacteriaceae]QZS50200.1 tellurium resistance protein TerW [Enterobacter cloacae complex sp.]AGO89195.1 ribbon-helix-helix protein, copG family [Raoultella planticola]ARD69431.1 Tellurium resistance protein TerW [Raoultella ornithinolytica]ARV42966.1 tellurium resistance protein TerW [Klebsiella pneumoniae subsp. pneumoniae]ASG37088.1 tellurium resistance protein TerW [Klebsiella pneumoniae]